MENSTTYGHHSITAFFDSRAAADKAKADVVQAGISSDLVKIVEGQAKTTSTVETPAHETGFWESLKEAFMPEEDRHTYAEGLRRGGYLLTVQTDETHYDHILDILDADGSVDMDQRETQWRSEGWTGRGVGVTEQMVSSPATTSKAATAASSATSVDRVEGAARPSAVGTGEETLQRAEETLRVGKRDVNHGRVRLRSYVVETPVHESVQLRSENVQVTRRPVDRALGAGEALFQERTIEAEEHEEVAVVSKEARVIEEVSLGKSVQDRTQQINDTVRRTEVEVEDARLASGAAGAKRFAATDAQTLIAAHMDVIASDGTKVGTVDHLDTGERIKLAKTTSPDAQHHFIPFSWIDHVDQHVHLNKPVRDVQAGWN